jgi:Uncharacterized protein conserved in bacteria (DUF2272)
VTVAAARLSTYHRCRRCGAAPRPLPPTSGPLRKNVVDVALRELARWNAGGLRMETDPRMRSVLADYWRRGAGVQVSEAQVADRSFQASHPWSAAFISWVMRQAGAGNAFQYSAAHANYIAAAKRNRYQNASDSLKAYRTSEVRPEPGDVICKSREGSGATYDNIRPGMKTHCDVVVSVTPKQVTVVGGNVDNSVKQRTLPLSSDGLLASRDHFAVIKVHGPARAAPLPGPAPRPPKGAKVLLGRTYYAGIELDIRSASGSVRPQTGIFCPANWAPSSSIDLLIYLHGIREPDVTIDSYWDAARNPHFALREEVAASGKNVLLVAPLLGPRSQTEIGLLARPGGLDQFVARVLGFLRSRGELRADARPGQVVLACHSGGGLAMRTMALAENQIRSSIRECWGFDCTYNRDDSLVWPRWARQSSGRLYLYYIEKSPTAPQALLIQRQGLPNVAVIASSVRSHNWVPRTHLLERLRASSFVQTGRQVRLSA